MSTHTHPGPRAVHAVNNALQILVTLAPQDMSHGEIREATAAVQRLIEPVVEDIAALFQDNEAKAAEIRELQEQGLRDKQFIDRLEDRNSGLNERCIALSNQLAAASRDVEGLYIATQMENQRTADRFNTVRRVRETLDPTLVGVPHAATKHTNAPQHAAAGA